MRVKGGREKERKEIEQGNSERAQKKRKKSTTKGKGKKGEKVERKKDFCEFFLRTKQISE